MFGTSFWSTTNLSHANENGLDLGGWCSGMMSSPTHGPPQGGLARSRWARKPRPIATLTVVAFLVALVVPPLIPSGGGIAYHYECIAGSRAVIGTFWTPLLIVNSPYGGFANGSATPAWASQNDSAPVNLSESNGSAAGIFVLDQWSMRSLFTRLAGGPGWNHSCSESEEVLVSVHAITFSLNGSSRWYLTVPLLPSGSTNDSIEPSRFNYSGYSSVVFGAEFRNNAGGIGTCYGPGFGTTLTEAGVQFEIPTVSANTTVLVPANLQVSVLDHYFFPGVPSTLGGVWLVMLTPSAGEAFEWSACP